MGYKKLGQIIEALDYKYPTLSKEYWKVEEVRNACGTLITISSVKWPLGRPGHKQNNKLNLSMYQTTS